MLWVSTRDSGPEPKIAGFCRDELRVVGLKTRPTRFSGRPFASRQISIKNCPPKKPLAINTRNPKAMKNIILISGDQAIFNGAIGPAIVQGPTTFVLNGSSSETHNGKKIVVVGDEKAIQPTVSYISREFQIPGQGMLSINLKHDQVARETKFAGKAVVLTGMNFEAILTVTLPALYQNTEIGPPVPDGVIRYIGEGRFLPIGRRELTGN